MGVSTGQCEAELTFFAWYTVQTLESLIAS